MADLAQNQVIVDVARQVVAEIAPQELVLFRPLSQAFFKDPEKTLKGGGGADRMLSLGGAAAAPLMTPLILQSTQLALDSLASRFVSHLNSELQRIDAWLTEIKARPTAAAVAESLPPADSLGPAPEVYDQVRQIVAQQLRQLKVPPEQADQLASKVSSALAGGKIARDALAQENRLATQVNQLKVEIDEIRNAREVEQIVDSDYFVQVCQRASELRRQAKQP